MLIKMSEKIPSTEAGDPDQDKKLLLPFAHNQELPTAQICFDLMLALNHWLQVPPKKLREIEEIIRMVSRAELLLDDIYDNSVLRDGIPPAHSIYGVASTMNAAVYVVFIALERLLNLGNSKVVEIYTKQILELHRGQGIEIYWRDNFVCPSEDEYKKMVIQKTAAMFMLALKLMQLFSDNKSDFSKLINIIGLYFQIRDDLYSLWGNEYADRKSYCEDLTEGKCSFPLIHAIKKQPEGKLVLNILKQRTLDVEVKKYCVSLLERLGSFQYTRETLESLDKEARDEIGRLGGNPVMTSLLDKLLSWRVDTREG